MKDKIIPVIAIIALVLSVWGLLSSPKVAPYVPAVPSASDIAQKFGAAGGMLAEQYIPYVRYNGGYKTELSFAVGSTTPKDIINIGAGKCNLTAGNGNGQTTMAATSTQMHFCAATGVRPGDQIYAAFPSAVIALGSSSPVTAANFGGSLQIVGVSATTSDIIGIAVFNGTGAATTSYSQATTGVTYFFVR